MNAPHDSQVVACTEQVIWITGASQGMGKLLATYFAKRGAKLILSSRSKDKLQVGMPLGFTPAPVCSNCKSEILLVEYMLPDV
jgi:NAD(P)-dependent dehydrogenase (short-subunit alcohol dehydrogenase family)